MYHLVSSESVRSTINTECIASAQWTSRIVGRFLRFFLVSDFRKGFCLWTCPANRPDLQVYLWLSVFLRVPLIVAFSPSFFYIKWLTTCSWQARLTYIFATATTLLSSTHRYKDPAMSLLSCFWPLHPDSLIYPSSLMITASQSVWYEQQANKAHLPSLSVTLPVALQSEGTYLLASFPVTTAVSSRASLGPQSCWRPQQDRWQWQQQHLTTTILQPLAILLWPAAR